MPKRESVASGGSGESGRSKESRGKFTEWVQTTQGIVSIISTVIALIGGGVSAALAINHHESHPSPSQTLTTGAVASTPDDSFSSSFYSQNDFNTPSNLAQLTEALLPPGALGSITATSYQTSLSDITETCGGLMPPGGQLASSVDITDISSGQYLQDLSVEWDNAADAARLVTNDHILIDQAGSCSVNADGQTYEWSGDYSGTAPLQCSNGLYFATQISNQSTSRSGFQVTMQCGRYVISIVLSGGTGHVPTQKATDDYLSIAVERLQQAIS